MLGSTARRLPTGCLWWLRCTVATIGQGLDGHMWGMVLGVRESEGAVLCDGLVTGVTYDGRVGTATEKEWGTQRWGFADLREHSGFGL